MSVVITASNTARGNAPRHDVVVTVKDASPPKEWRMPSRRSAIGTGRATKRGVYKKVNPTAHQYHDARPHKVKASKTL